ncbi:uncharacterized protein LOC109826677 [Asparagus officinalis]|uniref:uncharacterized protein LOC109826677 n=1 Tax=Asparagus officinalis TaxID=4686 RepID=UPI00098DE789|nr:uncharacterized protein LOC109826677 [Asparagus officinalis]
MSSGKFLRFVVTTKGIYIDPDKVKVIHELQPPKNLKELRGLQGRLAYFHGLERRALLLSQYDLHFKQQKSVKGQAICDLLAANLMKDTAELYEDLLDETHEVNTTSHQQVWQLYFDGASQATNVASTPGCSKISSGIGVILVSPEKHILPQAYSLTESCSNNIAEYNALLIGLSFAKELGVKYLKAFGDSQLIVNQVRGEYEVRNPDLILYYQATIEMANLFEEFFIEYIPRL